MNRCVVCTWILAPDAYEEEKLEDIDFDTLCTEHQLEYLIEMECGE
jgi:hypothetical protein